MLPPHKNPKSQSNNDDFTASAECNFQFIRLNNSLYTILQLLDEVAQKKSIDYFIDLVPVRSNAAAGVNNITLVIKVRRIDRKYLSYDDFVREAADWTLGPADEIYQFTEQPHIKDYIISRSAGEEQVNKPNNVMILGAPKQEVYFTENCPMGYNSVNYYPCTGVNINPYAGSGGEFDLNIMPYWGKDAFNENLIKSRYHPSGYWEVQLDFLKINNSLQRPIPDRYNLVTEAEVRASLGNYDFFQEILVKGNGSSALSAYASGELQLTRQTINTTGIDAFSPDQDGNPKASASDLLVLTKNDSVEKISDLKKVYNFLHSFASEYYMKQFMVHVPFVCKTQPDLNTGTCEPSGAYLFTDDPAPDGGWLEGTGLYHHYYPSFASDFFTDDQNRIQAGVVFRDVIESGLVVDNLNQDDYIFTSGTFPFEKIASGCDSGILNGGQNAYTPYNTGSGVIVQADLNDTWVTGQPILTGGVVSFAASGSDPISALLSISEAPSYKIESLTELIPIIPLTTKEEVLGVKNNQLPNNFKAPVAEGLDTNLLLTNLPQFANSPSLALPVQAHFAIKNNTDTYGPFVARFNKDNTTIYYGNTKVTQDTSLTPWDFGGYDAMERAGNIRAYYQLSTAFRTERGSVTVAGYPIRSVGDDILGTSSHMLSDRTLNTVELGVQQSISGSVAAIRYNYHITNGIPPLASNTLISNLNVNVGAGGFTTSYTLRTYTPEFGRTAEAEIERIRKNSLEILEQQKEQRNKNKLLASSKTAKGKRTPKPIRSADDINKKSRPAGWG